MVEIAESIDEVRGIALGSTVLSVRIAELIVEGELEGDSSFVAFGGV